ncbi:MAG: D-alanyl-D-alanine carboxypeptidase family protein [Chlamydiota bacterium]
MRWMMTLFWAFAVTASALELPVDALSAIVINADSGAVLFEKKADERCFPASLTKVATALYILEREGLDFTRTISPSEEALFTVHADKKQANITRYPPHRLEHNGAKAGLRPGKKLPLWAAFYGMLIKSGNDCANALAESFEKSIPDFMQCMNAYLGEIGCKNTHFLNPHGLHHPMHRTTARDLALIAAKACKSEIFREVVSSRGFFLEVEGEKKKKWEQGNKLLDPKSLFYYPFATGIKIGYTEKSGCSLLASAEKNGRKLILVLLGCPKSKKRYQEAIKLFEAAFAEEKTTNVLVEKQQRFLKKWEKQRVEVEGFLKRPCVIDYYPSEKPSNLTAFVHWSPLRLPIAAGDVVGRVEVLSGDKVLIEEHLYASRSIPMPLTMKIRAFFKRLFFWT